MAQQQREAERQLCAEATICSSDHYAVECRVSHDGVTSVEKDEFNRIQMQEFASQAEEATGAQRNIFTQEA